MNTERRAKSGVLFEEKVNANVSLKQFLLGNKSKLQNVIKYSEVNGQ